MITDVVKRNEDSILTYLKELNNNSLVQLWNFYCSEQNNDSDSMIYENDEEFFENWGADVMEVVRSICFGDYTYSHKFVTFNGYANLETTDYPEDKMDLEALASDIFENESDYSDYIELEEEEED